MNIQDYQGILVFAEQREGVISSVAFELLSKARELAEEKTMTVSALLMGHGIAHLANELHAAGADHVIIVDDQTLSHYLTEPYTHAFHQVIVAKKPEIVMLGATTIGRDLGPRLSARLMTGLTADCTQLDMSPDGQIGRAHV